MRWLFPLIVFLSVCTPKKQGFSKQYELCIATMFQDEAPYLKEWIEYHLMVGVEHFWLYDNGSQDNFEEVLTPYIEEGIIEIIPWNKPLCEEDIQERFPAKLQAEMVKDALIKAKEKSTWLSVIDVDEFIFPKKEKTIPECLQKHFSDASAVFASWMNFGTSGLYIPKGNPLICQLSGCMMKSHPKNGNGKSIWRPEEVDLESIHWVHSARLTKGVGYRNGDGTPVIMDGEGADWDWDYHDKYIRINHYFLRDENFFQQKRLALSQRGEGVYSEEVLWGFHDLMNRQKDQSMKNFIKKHHPSKYTEYWGAYE